MAVDFWIGIFLFLKTKFFKKGLLRLWKIKLGENTKHEYGTLSSCVDRHFCGGGSGGTGARKWMRQFYLLFSTVENMIVLYRFKKFYYVVIKYYQSKVNKSTLDITNLFVLGNVLKKAHVLT